MVRGAGYCMYTQCNEYGKAVFILNPAKIDYSCPSCRQLGILVTEKSFSANDLPFFREVRVEFDYDPLQVKYKQIAVVSDEALPAGLNVCVVQSPLVKTEKRALAVAEAALANLNRYGARRGMGENVLPMLSESILDFGLPIEDFRVGLAQLGEDLTGMNDRLKEVLKTRE